MNSSGLYKRRRPLRARINSANFAAMRASVAVSIVALFATTGAVWYFGAMPFKVGAPSPGMRSGSSSTERARRVAEPVPDDLPGLAAFLSQLKLEERAQFVREKVAPLDPAKPADREKIRVCLLSGANVEIERPSRMPSRISIGDTTTLRRYLLELLEKFPPAEGIPLAKAVLAKASDFRESYLCLRALEQFQPGANRDDAAATMQRTLAAAAKPVRGGREIESYIGQYDRFAEPIAQYALTDLHPQVMEMLKANPTMAGRYTQAVEAFPEAQQIAAYNDLFAQPAIAQELVNATGTRSADVWLSPTFRQQAARMFAGMGTTHQEVFINSLGQETGLHFVPKPLAEPERPSLQPTDPDKDAANAKARLAMLEAVVAQAKTNEVKAAATEARGSIESELAENATLPRRRFSPVNLPILDPLGAPAGSVDQTPGATPGSGTPPEPAPGSGGN